ncbi:hypothetical protein O0L34_g5512 [Tuta absoluta]|nr:hypothetical protein O0L34_g5512 [Tuta absoluta]
MNYTRTIFAVAIFLALVTKSNTAESSRQSGLSILGLEDSREYILPAEDAYDLEETRSNIGGAVLLTIKNQFKVIVEELCLQIFQYVTDIFYQFKAKLLNKLDAYTLKDVLSAVLDGVADFVVESPPNVNYYRNVDRKRKISVSQVDPSFFDGYGLAALHRSKRTF